MDLVILGIGRLRSSFREACDDYLRRLSRYTKVSEIEVREASRAPTVEAQREEEAGRLRARMPGGATVVALARQLAIDLWRWRTGRCTMADLGWIAA